jgi:cell division protein FtsL
MSTAAGHASQRQPEPRPAAPLLRAVAPARRQHRLPFLLLTAALVVAGVLALVVLNVTVSQQAFAIAHLRQANHDAETRYNQLQAQVDTLRAPARIAQLARAHGMVPAGRPRVATLPGSAAGSAPPEAATSPAASGEAAGAATSPAAPDSDQAWSGDPFPLKRYLAEP